MGAVQGGYATHLQARGLRPATIHAYLWWLHRAATDLGDLDGLTTADLEAWIAAHHWAPASQRKCVQALQAYYRWRGLATAVPLHPARVPRAVPDPCPDAVLDAALGAATGEDYWRLRLAADTGLRRAELAVVADTDVRESTAGPVLRVVGKGGDVRLVPLPPDVAGWLRARHGPAFGWTPGGVGEWYGRHLGRNVHSLRHRYATKAYAASHDLTAVQRLLVHASVATTQQYVAVGDDTLAAAAAGVWQRPRLRAV